ncbi:MAG TPA: hypothetical protein VGE52_18305, partial [Pirellulales bacterium]
EPLAPSTLAPDLSPETDRLVLRLLSKTPHDRPFSAGELRHDLVSLLAERNGAPPVLHERLGL